MGKMEAGLMGQMEDFTIKFYPGVLPDLLSKQFNEHINMLEKTLNLTTTKCLLYISIPLITGSVISSHLDL